MKNNQPIKSLAELRLAKKALKLKIDEADQRAKKGLVVSSISKLFDTVENSGNFQTTKLGLGVNTALGFLSKTAGKTLKLNNRSNSLLSIGIAIAAPIIAKKLQEYIDKKF